MLEVHADKLGRRMLKLHIRNDLLPFVSLCVVSVCNHGRMVFEFVQHHLCEAWRPALARDIVVLNMTPTEKVRESHSEGCLATANGGNRAQNNITSDLCHYKRIQLSHISCICTVNVLEFQEVIAESDDPVVIVVLLSQLRVCGKSSSGVKQILLGD